jgi:hypothetical protein
MVPTRFTIGKTIIIADEKEAFTSNASLMYVGIQKEAAFLIMLFSIMAIVTGMIA